MKKLCRFVDNAQWKNVDNRKREEEVHKKVLFPLSFFVDLY